LRLIATTVINVPETPEGLKPQEIANELDMGVASVYQYR